MKVFSGVIHFQNREEIFISLIVSEVNVLIFIDVNEGIIRNPDTKCREILKIKLRRNRSTEFKMYFFSAHLSRDKLSSINGTDLSILTDVKHVFDENVGSIF